MAKKLIFAAIFCLFSCTAADAASLTKQQQQLKELSQQINIMRQGIDAEQQQRNNIQQTLNHNKAVIAQLDKQLSKNKQHLQQQQLRLTQLQQEQTALEQRLQRQQRILAAQIRQFYRLSLAIKTNTNVSNPYALQYLTYINKARLQLIHELHTAQVDVNQHQQQTKQQAQQLQQQQKQQQQQENLLLQQHKQHQQVLSELSSEISDRQQQLATLLANKQALEKLIQQLQRRQTQFVQPHAPFGDSRTKLNWPTKGNITKHFGTPIDQSGLKYAGVFLKAPLGQEVFSIYPGRVIFANWLAGYGLLVILDHGNGYMTLYAYNQNLRKKVGDTVRAGDIIATVGDTSNPGQSGLYFEIRFNGHPIDPQLWCH